MLAEVMELWCVWVVGAVSERIRHTRTYSRFSHDIQYIQAHTHTHIRDDPVFQSIEGSIRGLSN